MNLLQDTWLPFRHRDGGVQWDAPAAIADPEIVDLACTRADFQGAAWQFLIGLLQTCSAPANRKAWLQSWTAAPQRDELQHQFDAFTPAFDLLGDGPRFMQDLDPLTDARTAGVSALLIDAPGEQGLKNNTDHFVKRGLAEQACTACAALALFTMNTNGPAGGTGFRVGLRGGGPLTTLVLPSNESASLWQKILLNVIARDRFGFADVTPDDSGIFPWLCPTRTSEPGSSTPNTTPEDMHPLHVYWSMPSRFRLQEAVQRGRCDICGRTDEPMVEQLKVKNYGCNYEGSWQHPLTPYRVDQKNSDALVSLKGAQGGIGYRHWEAFVLRESGSATNRPARVVEDFLKTKHPTLNRLGTFSRQARLWVFGYDMKQNKPRCWYSTQMPLIAVPEERQDTFLYSVRQLTQAARATAWQTRNAVKSAWFSNPADAKGDFTFIEQRFWEATTEAFYDCLSSIADALEVDAPDPIVAVAERWWRALSSTARMNFDDLALSGDSAALDLKRVIRARNRLGKWLASGKEMKQLRQLANPEDAA